MESRKALLRVVLIFGLLPLLVVGASAGTPIPIHYGDYVNGTIDTPATFIPYQFSGTAGEPIYIRLKTSWESNGEIKLRAPNGTIIADPSDWWGTSLTKTLPDTGLYQIQVGDLEGDNTGTYDLYLQRTRDPANPVPIQDGETLNGTIPFKAMWNTYTYNGRSNDTIYLRLKTSWESNGEIKLHAPNGTIIVDQSDWWGTSFTKTLPETGNYTILVGDAEGDDTGGTYNLYLQFVGTYRPVTDFSANKTAGQSPLAVMFTDTSYNSPYQWKWNFGDGGSSTEQNPVHTYGAYGKYPVTLTTTNNYGNDTATKTAYINVGPIPVANFTATPRSGQAPLTVRFTDTSSYSPAIWSWTFGDGSPENATVKNPFHTYAKGGTYTVILAESNAYGSNTTKQINYITVTDPPIVTGISPTAGPTSGGTVVTITGSRFTGATSVKFGTTPGTNLTVVSATRITVKSPAHAAGVVDVRVMSPNGTSAIVPGDMFTYTPRPAITGISPKTGPASGGTVVTITGTGFTGATSVNFGTAAGTNLIVISATQITITSPAHAAGVVDVKVTTPGGASALVPGDRFTYGAAPTVTGISPESGPTAGGTMVTITGTGFFGVPSIRFGTTAGPAPTIVTPTQITIFSPAHATGVVDITVTTPNGTSASSAADGFTYAPRPTVTSISPISGPVSGGTVVNITGTGFTGVTAVMFGDIPAFSAHNSVSNNQNLISSGTKMTMVSATKITIRSPAHAAGVVNITVTTPGGTSAVSSADRFMYT